MISITKKQYLQVDISLINLKLGIIAFILKINTVYNND